MSTVLTSLIPAGIALIGVFVGGIVTYFANLKIKNKELNHQLFREERQEKRILYAQFLSEVNIAALKAIDNKADAFSKLQTTSALLAQIQLLSNSEVHVSARDIYEILLNMYAQVPKESNGNLAVAKADFIKNVKIESSVKYT